MNSSSWADQSDTNEVVKQFFSPHTHRSRISHTHIRTGSDNYLHTLQTPLVNNSNGKAAAAYFSKNERKIPSAMSAISGEEIELEADRWQ